MIRSLCLVAVVTVASPIAAEVLSNQAFVGNVVDESDAPVEGATVEMLNESAGGNVGDPPDEPPTGTAKTKSDGTFRLPIGGSPHELNFGVLKATAADGRVGLAATLQKATKPRPIRIVLRPTRELTVRVTDGEKAPVADAQVRVLSNNGLIAGGRTDANGRWSGYIPSRMSWWTVLARKPGLGFDYQNGPSPKPFVAAELRSEIVLTLDGALAIRVKAVDREGQPVAGVWVAPSNIRRPGREGRADLYGLLREMPVTGDDGIVVLDALPATVAKPIEIIAVSREWDMLKYPQRIDISEGVREVTIEMRPMSSISGRVTGADGTPAAGVAVKACGEVSDRRMGRGFALTDADGRYRMTVPADQIYLVAAVDEPKMRAATYRDEVLVLSERPPEGIDFTLGPATALTGQVKKADTTPAKGVLVHLSADLDRPLSPEALAQIGADSRLRGAASENIEDRTDAEGRYRFIVGPGKYRLFTSATKERLKVTVPPTNPPGEITRDFATLPSDAKLE